MQPTQSGMPGDLLTIWNESDSEGDEKTMAPRRHSRPHIREVTSQEAKAIVNLLPTFPPEFIKKLPQIDKTIADKFKISLEEGDDTVKGLLESKEIKNPPEPAPISGRVSKIQELQTRLEHVKKKELLHKICSLLVTILTVAIVVAGLSLLVGAAIAGAPILIVILNCLGVLAFGGVLSEMVKPIAPDTEKNQAADKMGLFLFRGLARYIRFAFKGKSDLEKEITLEKGNLTQEIIRLSKWYTELGTALKMAIFHQGETGSQKVSEFLRRSAHTGLKRSPKEEVWNSSEILSDVAKRTQDLVAIEAFLRWIQCNRPGQANDDAIGAERE